MAKPNLTLGVELEVEVVNDPFKLVPYVSKYTIYGSYPKHQPLGHTHGKHGTIVKEIDEAMDGSIEVHYDNTINDGFELIGKPMTFNENEKYWTKLLGLPSVAAYAHGDDVKVTNHTYGIHDCGMHVHVSGDIYPVLLGKVVVFINKSENKPFLEYIAGRTLNKFCSTDPSIKPFEVEELYHNLECRRISKRGKKMVMGVSGKPSEGIMPDGGYCCANSTKAYGESKFKRGAVWVLPAFGAGDFEVRVFKSTVKPERFMTNLEFIVAMVEYCEQSTVGALTFKDFSNWLSQMQNRIRYTSLFKYLRKSGYTTGIIPSKTTLAGWVREGKITLEEAA